MAKTSSLWKSSVLQQRLRFDPLAKGNRRDKRPFATQPHQTWIDIVGRRRLSIELTTGSSRVFITLVSLFVASLTGMRVTHLACHRRQRPGGRKEENRSAKHSHLSLVGVVSVGCFSCKLALNARGTEQTLDRKTQMPDLTLDQLFPVAD